MSSDPSTAPTPVAEFVATNRSVFAGVLVGIGVLGLALAVFAFSKTLQSSTVKADTPDQPEVTIADPHRLEYASAGLLGVSLTIFGLGVGLWQLVSLPKPDRAGQLREARIALLLGGGLIGLVLMIAGTWFFLLYFSSLTAWLDGGKKSEAKWVLVPVIVSLLGAGLAFAATQPARSDERDNPTLRRLVYGSNVGLSAALLLLLLLVGNVFAALKVPNKLDTTETGFYTLSDATKELLAGLNQPVTAYSTLFPAGGGTGRRLVSDASSLLAACHDVNPSKFRVRTLDPSLDREEIKRLATKFPKFDRESMGILLVVGEPEGEAEFLRAEDLFDEEGAGRGPGRFVFKGEGQLVSKLLFLSESKVRPVVYFTQGSGELEVIAGAPGAQRAAPGRTAHALAEMLKKTNADVKALEFDLALPKVPDDAAVVVVADPVTPLAKEHADAIRHFMMAPKSDGKKGKLILLTSPHAKAGGGDVAPTGLEDVLTGFGVRIGNEYILNQRTEPFSYTDIPVAVNAPLVDSRNPIAQTYSEQLLVFPDAREVTPIRETPGVTAEPLFISLPGRYSWLETKLPTDPGQTWQDLVKSADLRTARKLIRNPRSVSIVVADPPAPNAPRGSVASGRVAVYGSGTFFADPPARERERAGSGRGAELLAATVDWMRDRPAAANVATKPYGMYERPAEMDPVRSQLIPIGVTLLTIIAFGLGVWVFRRA